MRRGNQGNGIHRRGDGTLLGINLGADYTAEHEWGIKRLRQQFQIDDAAEGVARRQIRHAPLDSIKRGSITLKTRNWETRKTTTATWWGVVALRYAGEPEAASFDEKDIMRWELTPCGDDEIAGAWDEGSFGFLLKDQKAADELYDAIAGLDLCIGLFNGESWNRFSRSGLGLLIASRVPQNVRDQWLKSDQEQRLLRDTSADTGIVKRLEKAGKRYFALSPKWMKDFGGSGSKSKAVIYWLNPMDQQDNNYGWFTVEELDQWIEGRGPIPMKKKQRASA